MNTNTPEEGVNAPQETTSDKVHAILESKETSDTITFHVAEHGIETSVDEVLSDADFQSRADEDFEPNRSWYKVTVANKEDMDRWVNLRNEYLNCSWSPNQSPEENVENADRMREIESEMRELENKAR